MHRRAIDVGTKQSECIITHFHVKRQNDAKGRFPYLNFLGLVEETMNELNSLYDFLNNALKISFS